MYISIYLFSPALVVRGFCWSQSQLSSYEHWETLWTSCQLAWWYKTNKNNYIKMDKKPHWVEGPRAEVQTSKTTNTAVLYNWFSSLCSRQKLETCIVVVNKSNISMQASHANLCPANTLSLGHLAFRCERKRNREEINHQDEQICSTVVYVAKIWKFVRGRSDLIPKSHCCPAGCVMQISCSGIYSV